MGGPGALQFRTRAHPPDTSSGSPYTIWAMKTVILTGIRRIGEVLAQRLLEEGYALAVVYRASREQADRLVQLGETRGQPVIPIQADLSLPGEGRRVVTAARNHLGPIQGLVHLASPYRRTPLPELQPADLQHHFWTIAGSFVEMVQALCADLSPEPHPQIHVVAFGDWAVDTSPYPGYLPYFAAKGALHAAVRALARELAPRVVINAVAPGPVWKPPDLPDAVWNRVLQVTPLRREASLTDLAQLTLFLLRTTSVTGEVIRVDGGRHLAGSPQGE